MKMLMHRPFLRLVLFILAAPFLAAAIPVDLTNAKIRQAVGYLAAHPTGTDALDAALAANGIKAGKFHDDIKQLVVVMQDIVAKQGVDFDSAGFWDLYRDSIKAAGVAVPGDVAAPPRVAASMPAAGPKKEDTVVAVPEAAPARVAEVANPPAAKANEVAVPPAPPADKPAEKPKGSATLPTPVPAEVAAAPAMPVVPAPSVPPAAPAVPAAPTDFMKTRALSLYATYATAHPGASDTDSTFAKFLADQGLEKGKLHDLLQDVRTLQADSGAKPGSDALRGLLDAKVSAPAEKAGLGADAAAPSPATGGAQSATPAKLDPKEITKAGQELWRKGLAGVAALQRQKRDVFLDYNLIDANEAEPAKKNSSSLGFVSRIRKNTDGNNQNSDDDANHVRFNALNNSLPPDDLPGTLDQAQKDAADLLNKQQAAAAALTAKQAADAVLTAKQASVAADLAAKSGKSMTPEIKATLDLTAKQMTNADVPLVKDKAKADLDLERQKADRLLIRVGYNSVVDASKTGGPAPTPEQKEAVDINGAAAVDTPPALDIDARLRNAGISFTAGFGLARSKSLNQAGKVQYDDKSIGTVVVRWNLIQRTATARWNQWVGDNNPDGYSLVPYFGHTEYYVPMYGIRDRPYPRKLTTQDANILSPTFFGPFFGTAAIGDKLPVPGATDGSTERPYLAGLSVGFSFYDEAAPLLYLDWGKTISPSHGLSGSRDFYGFSLDAAVLAKIVSSTRNASTPAVPK